MSVLTVLFLALAMSTDAFAVAVCKGTTLNVPRFFDALKVGILFGLVEAATPIFGWLLGYMVTQYIEQWDHWIIFILMLILGARMIYGSTQEDECGGISDKSTDNISKKTTLVLFIAAVSTSIDAFVLGASLALVNVNIGFAATMIGLATCIMVTIGILLGKKIGCYIGKKAEFLGGCVLILIGSITLYQHLCL